MSRTMGLFPLLIFTILLASCGGGGGKDSGVITITSATRCSFDMDQSATVLLEIPANCEVENIDTDSFVTDQSVIHLSGRSFGPASDNCSNPPLSLGGLPCLPVFPGSEVIWENLSTGQSGSGSSGYGLLGFNDPHWYPISAWASQGAGWSTYNPLTYPTDIPLALGSNSLQISLEDAAHRGTREVTILRVPDVTPPSVFSVLPESDGIYSWRILVYFTEQLNPESLTDALQVFDDLGQPVPVSTEYDPFKLFLVWYPSPALTRGATYTARLSGIADLADNTMINDYEWSFTAN